MKTNIKGHFNVDKLVFSVYIYYNIWEGEFLAIMALDRLSFIDKCFFNLGSLSTFCGGFIPDEYLMSLDVAKRVERFVQDFVANKGKIYHYVAVLKGKIIGN
ncbi:MAG: hypothetical protein GX197_10195 [Firmicutes bacterium]|nr:hypothetical protein [Bacillota bacterium]